MLEKLKELLGQINTRMVAIYLAIIVFGSALLGFVAQLVITNMDAFLVGTPFRFDLRLLIRPGTWATGFIVVIVFMSVVWIGGGHMGSASSRGTGMLSKAASSPIRKEINSSRPLPMTRRRNASVTVFLSARLSTKEASCSATLCPARTHWSSVLPVPVRPRPSSIP